MSKLFQFKNFVAYWLHAVDAHSLHSPFLFDFYVNVVKNKSSDMELRSIRKDLFASTQTIDVNDLGAGSVHLKSPRRKIGDIAATSTTPEKFSLLYSRIIRHYRYENIVELGTSLGINTLYLVKATPSGKVSTFEGVPGLVSFARELFRKAKFGTINLIEGNIDDTLPGFIASSPPIDFAFMDANHRVVPTLRYFELLLTRIHDQSMIIMDDIYYSAEMKEAWQTIQTYERVVCTLDLFRCGIILFDRALSKQNVVLDF